MENVEDGGDGGGEVRGEHGDHRHFAGVAFVGGAEQRGGAPMYLANGRLLIAGGAGGRHQDRRAHRPAAECPSAPLSDFGPYSLRRVWMNGETAAVKALSICVSNDPHVIALARISGARLLCSRDQKLHSDFGNKHLVDNPRGSVYQDIPHAPLIARHCKLGKKRADRKKRR